MSFNWNTSIHHAASEELVWGRHTGGQTQLHYNLGTLHVIAWGLPIRYQGLLEVRNARASFGNWKLRLPSRELVAICKAFVVSVVRIHAIQTIDHYPATPVILTSFDDVGWPEDADNTAKFANAWTCANSWWPRDHGTVAPGAMMVTYYYTVKLVHDSVQLCRSSWPTVIPEVTCI